MKVYLAGFNVDTTVLKELENIAGKREDLTPEVLSAAYARISRDPRPIDQIRQSAREEVERSRRSNSTIIFKMGHHSVAEHAMFNFDIIGLSRFAMEDMEKFRLCSYTEKSQRYITLDKDYVVPEEIKGTKFEEMFRDIISEQNRAYFKLLAKLKEHVFAKHPDLAGDERNHNLLEGWAKEDARYITALATESQVGYTANARNLELVLRRFASHPLAEVRKLGNMLYDRISRIAPSIVIFHKANDRDTKTYPELKILAGEVIGKVSKDNALSPKEVDLVEFTPEGDNRVAAALLHSSCAYSYEKCKKAVENLSQETKAKLFKAACRHMQFYDSMVREFEYVNLTYNLTLSSACFGQLKRHRMSSITAQSYDPALGNTIPESIKEIGMEKFFKEIISKTNEVYDQIFQEIPLAAPYILTNSHRKRVLIRLNARELYHISRMREDKHAQWDIQNISGKMTDAAKKVMPLTFSLAGGKDRYNDMYRNLFGELPQVTEASLPGARKIG